MKLFNFQNEKLVNTDIKTGDQQTFIELVSSLTSQDGRDVFAQTGSDIVQVDVPTGRGVTRVHLQKNGENVSLSMWAVDAQGSPVGDSADYMSYQGENGRATVLRGSSKFSLDGGDLAITPRKFADKLHSVIDGAKEKGFKIVIP